jgi:hypothetical protein
MSRFVKGWGFLLICFFVLVSTASAASQFGSRFLRDPGCCTLYGGRANIDAVNLNPGTALAAARVEADNAGQYLIQSGFIRTQNVGWAHCPDVTTRHRFYEVLTPTGTYCNSYTDQTLTRGAVIRLSAGSTIWGAYLDGSKVFEGPVGFSTASGYLAGDEMNGTGGPMTARFGVGDFPWQRATAIDGSSYFTIQSSEVFRAPLDKWNIGSLPSPFTISGP